MNVVCSCVPHNVLGDGWDRDRLSDTRTAELPHMPTYFRFLTVLGLKIFLEEGVDVAVVEVGMGGRLDATNVIPRPVVTGAFLKTSSPFFHLAASLREIPCSPLPLSLSPLFPSLSGPCQSGVGGQVSLY